MKASYSLAFRYSKAFVEFLSQNNKINALDSYIEILKTLDKKIQQDEEFSNLFKNPVISQKHVLNKTLEYLDKSGDEILSKFLSLIIENKRQELLANIIRHLRVHSFNMKRLVRVKLTTAKELSNETKDLIFETITKKTGRKISISYTLDESLIGGIQMEFDDKLFDYSVKGYLDSIIRDVSSRG